MKRVQPTHDAAHAETATIALGISRWKRPFLRCFVSDAPGRLSFRRISRGSVRYAAVRHAQLLIWAAREPAWLPPFAAKSSVALTRIEDGFLRSVGLGSDLVPALSLVVDDLGIYFDPGRESRLERLLNGAAPTAELLLDAQRLRRRLIESRSSKYNLQPQEGRTRLPLDLGAGGRRVILVPGQVEDDSSIRLGSPRLQRNLDLLSAVRSAAPDAVLLYKPHPDVESGNRRGKIPEAAARRLADYVLHGWDAPSALDVASEVHTMTSQLGFEALLRELPVTLYGLPFYAGLGLTTDHLPWPRPRRAVDLDTLVAAAFFLYARYRDPVTGAAITPFDAIDIIEREREAQRRGNRHIRKTLWRSFRLALSGG